MKYNITKKDIEETLNELLDSKVNKERHIVAWTGCKTYGTINIMEIQCDNPECIPCSTFKKAFLDEINKWKI